MRDLAAGRFSIARFYERRARRIVPALALVLAATVPVGAAWMSPPELRGLGAGIVASALSVSNVLYWLQLDYFGPDAHRLPLLHTWSLGIEEQFYLLFPPALALVWRRARPRLRPILAAALMASLALAAWAAEAHPQAGFFLLPFRGWELLLGCLLAAAPPRLGLDGGPAADALAAVGLAGIVAAMAAVPLGLAPGVAPNLVACLGAGLVLACARPGAPATRLLALPPFVGIGLVSYSAYLWHQPLLAFARIRFGDALPPGALLALGGLALVLAWPTWAFVERPFRRPGAAPGAVLAAAGAALALLAAVGLAGVLTQGLAVLKPAPVRAILASVSDTNPHRDACKTGLDDPTPAHPRPGCLVDGTRPAVAFWGDSHADALQGGFWPAAEAAGFRFYSVTRSACPPVPGLTRTGGAASPACDAWVRAVEAFAARDFPVVVLAARWTAGVAPTGFDNGEGGAEGPPGDFLTPIGAAPATPAAREAAVIATYVRGIEALLARGHRVVLVYPIPEAGWNVPEELARRREASAGPVTLTTAFAAYARRQAAVIAAFDAIADPHLFRVRPAAVLCGRIPGRCLDSLGDRPLYFDDNHLTTFGASLVAPAMIAAIEAARSSLAR